MRVKIKNLGVIKQAKFSLGDMTILCGENNTGKTYATYALFGFLQGWRRTFSMIINDDVINRLLSDGTVRIDTNQYVKDIPKILSHGCVEYSKMLLF